MGVGLPSFLANIDRLEYVLYVLTISNDSVRTSRKDQGQKGQINSTIIHCLFFLFNYSFIVAPRGLAGAAKAAHTFELTESKVTFKEIGGCEEQKLVS